jgi:hypothetical protein
VFALLILLPIYVHFSLTNFIEQVDHGKLIITQGLKKFLPFMESEGLLLCSQDLIAEPYPEPV